MQHARTSARERARGRVLLISSEKQSQFIDALSLRAIDVFGVSNGAAAMVSSLGMAAGPAVGGWIYDTFGQYTWMYVYSAAIGLGAVAIAFAFPPFPSKRPLAEASPVGG